MSADADAPRFLRLQRFSGNDYLIVNIAEIACIKPAERCTALILLRNGVTEHVLDSVQELAGKLQI